ncbi:recombinase family protein [Roseomonas harenae]|uniref:recombinase family protein n=1 Tax=Muricoccus harenae TaxID=2692566 RepID=UPI00133133D5|nr:recombinase family protein [Roseomonas harenae]
MAKRLAYSYLRFSNPEQAKGNSIRRQMELAAAYAAEQGWELDHSLKDEGLSAYKGHHVSKGAFGAFLREVEGGRVPRGSVLIVESLDRISRAHPLDALTQFQALLKAGIEIVTLTDRRLYSWETVRDQPLLLMGSLMVMSRANEESETKSRRICDAWANKRAKLSDNRDKPLTSRGPKWLRWNDTSKRWDLIPDRVAVVKRIFTMTADEGTGMVKLAGILNAERVPTFTGKTHSKGTEPGWQPSTIGKILKSRSVLGEFHPRQQVSPGVYKPDSRVQPIADYYPAVISHDLWNRVHAVRAQNDKTGGGRKDGRVGNIFRGRVFCHHCGNPPRLHHHVKGGKRYNYFKCGAVERGTGTCTNRVNSDIDQIEKGVLAGLKFRQAFWEQQTGENAQARALTEQLAGLADEHARKQKRFDALSEMLAEEDSVAIRTAYRELGRELDSWEDRKADLERRIAMSKGTTLIGDMIREADELEAASRSADLDICLPARNRLMVMMGSVIGRIEFDRDKVAHVTLADDSLRFRVVRGEVEDVAFNVRGVWHALQSNGTMVALAAE